LRESGMQWKQQGKDCKRSENRQAGRLKNYAFIPHGLFSIAYFLIETAFLRTF
jgi:hypothetical protein